MNLLTHILVKSQIRMCTMRLPTYAHACTYVHTYIYTIHVQRFLYTHIHVQKHVRIHISMCNAMSRRCISPSTDESSTAGFTHAPNAETAESSAADSSAAASSAAESSAAGFPDAQKAVTVTVQRLESGNRFQSNLSPPPSSMRQD